MPCWRQHVNKLVLSWAKLEEVWDKLGKGQAKLGELGIKMPSWAKLGFTCPDLGPTCFNSLHVNPKNIEKPFQDKVAEGPADS